MKADGNTPLQNPRARCNFLEALTFTWTRNIFQIGHKRAIEISDIFEPLTEHASGDLGEKFSEEYDREKIRRKPKLYRQIFKYFKWEIILYFLVTLVREFVLRVSQPLLLGLFMSYYDEDGPLVEGVGPHWAALALVASYLLYVLMAHPCAMGVSHLGLKYRVAVGSLIYRKSLRLSHHAFGRTSVGQIVNLLSNDMRRFDMGTVLQNYLIIGPMQTVIMGYFIWREIGISSVIGMSVLLALIPFQFWMSSKIYVLLSQAAKLTDKRVQLTHEVITGVQLIKMYALEEKFNRLVHLARLKEIDKIKRISYLKGITASFRMFNTRLCIFVSILIYVLLGNKITSQKFFVTVCFYEILKQTMTSWFPDAITLFKEMSATLGRIEEFLSRDERDEPCPPFDNSLQKVPRNATKEHDNAEEPLISSNEFAMANLKVPPESDSKQENCHKIIGQLDECHGDNNLKYRDNAITMHEVSVKWAPEQPVHTLENITIEIAKGSFVAICGAVGSGKSTFLYALLRELPCDRETSKGHIKTNGNISYAPQEPWLFSGTIKENILFGSTMDSDRYGKVCETCALGADFESLSQGDRTHIGERGHTLSGGQRARVSLARALYKEADIYLLDDPLSAVDSKVGKNILHGIEELLKGKTVLLVTHQLHYTRKAYRIVKLENGKIVEDVHFEGNEIENCVNSEESKKSNEEGKVLQKEPSANPGIAESQRTGTVKWEVYKGYVVTSGPGPFIILLLALATLTQILASGFDYWNKYWVHIEENIYSSLNPSIKNMETNGSSLKMNYDSPIKHVIENISIPLTEVSQNTTFSAQIMEQLSSNRPVYIGIYAGIVIFLISVTMIRSLMFYWMAMNASMKYHDDMLHSITRARMEFFHTNPSGRILNRFSQDIGFIDDLLPLLILDVLQMFFQLVGILLIVTILNVSSLVVVGLIAIVITFIRNYYIKTSRSVRRLEGITRSPVFSHLDACMQGVVTIRAMKAEKQVVRKFNEHQDLYTSASFMCMGTSRAFAYWLDLITLIFIGFVILVFLVKSGNIEGNIGLAVTQVIGLATMFQWGMRQTTVLENQMINVERIQEYIKLDAEPPLKTDNDDSLPTDWPNEGRIEFKNVHLKYAESAHPSLREISFSISPKQKIGVVGRTGSGKTSLVNALFRMAYVDGEIQIDGVDTTIVGLHALRRRIFIIPQQPVLFSGTLKDNLDPFDACSDAMIWKALEQVELKKLVGEREKGLHCEIAEGGSNFSAGEKQLICLARAVLQKNKIIILDEATANVDEETNALIQTTIRNIFSESTIITIAHRLQTVMDSDKILVMDAGRVVEYDTPYKLLHDENSAFFKMAALEKSL